MYILAYNFRRGYKKGTAGRGEGLVQRRHQLCYSWGHEWWEWGLMARAGARSYNGGLVAEPPAEVQGQSPQWELGGLSRDAEAFEHLRVKTR